MMRLLLILGLWLTPSLAHAAFPVVATSASTTDTNGTSTVVSMPASIAVGDLLLVLCNHAATTELAESGGPNFTRVAVGNSTFSYAAFARIATANASDALTVAGSSGHTICHAMRITGHGYTGAPDIMTGTAATGTSTTPNPPNVAHGGPQDYLVLEQFVANTVTESATYWSTNYSAMAQSETAAGILSAVAQYAVNNTAEDPGNMSIGASVFWLTQTYSIPPALGTEYTKFSDAFTRTDSTELGADWTPGYTAFNNLQIVGNEVRATVLNTDSIETNPTTLTDAQWAQVKLVTFTGAQVNAPRVLVRYSAPATVAGYECSALANAGGLNSRIGKLNAGFTTLASSSTTTVAAGDTIKCYAIGTRITMRNQVASTGAFTSILTAVDTTHTSGLAGIQTFVATGGSLANSELDAFASGDFTAPAGGSCRGALSLLGVGGC